MNVRIIDFLTGLAFVAVLLAILTANARFPAAAAETAADQIIGEVWQVKSAQAEQCNQTK